MNEIIPVKVDVETKEQLVNARDLHKALERKKDFSDWIKQKIEKYGFIEGEDFSTFKGRSEVGRNIIEYVLTLDMAKELAMVDGSDKGREVRRYFINCEKELKEMHFKAIEIFNKSSNNRTFRDLASLLNINGLGGNKLGKWAKDKGYVRELYGNTYEPYRQYIDKGYFEVIERYNKDIKRNVRTTLITPKGCLWFHKKLTEDGYNPKRIFEIVLEQQPKGLVFGRELNNKISG